MELKHVGTLKTKESTGKGYPQRDQGEGPGVKMPKRDTTARVNKGAVKMSKGRPMGRPGAMRKP